MTTSAELLDIIKNENIEFVSFRFTDPRGKWQQLTQSVQIVSERTFDDGIMMDGSSIAGWKGIQESDMVLIPDTSTTMCDPFTRRPTLVLICDTCDPRTRDPYERCPRQIGRKAADYLRSTGIAETAWFGPEPEFFVFDDVRSNVTSNEAYYFVDSSEGPYNSGREYPEGNMGHRPPVKGGYFPAPPVDSLAELRSEMLANMIAMGVPVEKHHHEVGTGQCELGFVFDELLRSADMVQIYKYAVQMTASQHGKSATFMPKPIVGDNGNGMHVHQSLANGDATIFGGDEYGGLSQEALYYIGGIRKHAQAINAFTNPTTNSYKRLQPGFEAPLSLIYASHNRSAAFRIPFASSQKARHIEVRFPDPAANPYLAYSVFLMAGLDGIQNKIDPGQPLEGDLFALPEEELAKIPQVCSSLDQALDALDADRDFLKQGGVFTDSFIDGYIALKREECQEFAETPHPIEFKLYYSV
ncbi:MAG: type I glutamate--ammonia ligase [Haliea sp.]|jgi:glutamine synthetase|nr:type I glutamate--ammonia ligase [Haliea sp.]